MFIRGEKPGYVPSGDLSEKFVVDSFKPTFRSSQLQEQHPNDYLRAGLKAWIATRADVGVYLAGLFRYARISSGTWPPTSVKRKSRPA